MRLFSSKVFNDFRSGPTGNIAPTLGDGRVFDAKAAAYNTANTPLVRRLRGRHLQMIAIGGSIGNIVTPKSTLVDLTDSGTGLFVGSGQALATGGPGSLLIGFLIIGSVLFCTVQALGEMTVTFPVAGSFNAYATRFIDPAWGFASGWNYAMQWLILMPLEIMAASLTLEYWSLPIPGWASITVFLGAIMAVNMCSVKVYGEVEYCFSIMKITAVIGFM